MVPLSLPSHTLRGCVRERGKERETGKERRGREVGVSVRSVKRREKGERGAFCDCRKAALVSYKWVLLPQRQTENRAQ